MARGAEDFRVIRPFGRGSCMQHGQISTLGRSSSLAGAVTCTPATPDHSATIGGHVGSAAVDLAWRPPSPCPWARPQPPTRHSQACCSASGRALRAAITTVIACTTAELFVRLGTALAAAGGGAKAPWVPSMARRPPRGCAAQVHQQALAWRPGKDTEAAPFLGGEPRAICGHHGQDLALHRAHAHISQAPGLLSQAQSEPLRSRLDPLDRE